MQKNVAGQKIGAQMVNASDGSAFTGAVTCYVTLDAGTQAVGSVGAGAATHEGNGYHTYAPSQAETNGDLAAYTFIGTGAIPATVQVFPRSDFTATQKASINAEVVDVLTVDTFAEPGQGAPAATASLATKIGYLFKAWRNKKTQTASQFSLFADDASTVDQKSTVTDDGSTTTVGEMATGP